MARPSASIPGHGLAYYSRGIAYSDLGDVHRAIADFDETIRINPENTGAFGNRGVAYRVLGQPGRAVGDFSEAIRLNPDDAQTLYNRANAFVSLGQFQPAIQDYDAAILIDPQFADAYSNRGVPTGAWARTSSPWRTSPRRSVLTPASRRPTSDGR